MRRLFSALLLLLLLLQLGRGGSPAAELYTLEITNNGPITAGAQATVQARLRMKNGNDTSNLYHFNWIYAPLILIEKSEQQLNSTINVAGEFPGTFPVSVWVTHKNCWLCRPVARNITTLQITEFITGNLTIAQIEDSRVTTHGSGSAVDTVTQISFSLHDPSHYFKSASFVYNWDFGDGVYQITKEPFVYCNCSSMGNRTVHLKVVAEWEQTGSILHEREIMQKTGDFTTALELLDAVKSINIVGSRETHVMENLNLSLHINGTPPLALCWLIKSECIPLEGDKCHLVEISGSCYNLSHTFRDAGQYCLSVRVENGVTVLQTYHGIKVRPAGLGESDVLLKLDTGSEEFMDYKDVFQEPEAEHSNTCVSANTGGTAPSGGGKCPMERSTSTAEERHPFPIDTSDSTCILKDSQDQSRPHSLDEEGVNFHSKLIGTTPIFLINSLGTTPIFLIECVKREKSGEEFVLILIEFPMAPAVLSACQGPSESWVCPQAADR
ncbi:hypothetical protein DUI87_05356 [Hirundo rustica rustica]|uniref:PKAT KLD domain-containing protein n=1 Tax=Hirundo rustica rustica TaxID=333673 RepID=A0A3M0KWK2_HIRRU|nr:hypothetical protein DUI87_05356 [Hirundo rustica rustica]